MRGNSRIYLAEVQIENLKQEEEKMTQIVIEIKKLKNDLLKFDHMLLS